MLYTYVQAPLKNCIGLHVAVCCEFPAAGLSGVVHHQQPPLNSSELVQTLLAVTLAVTFLNPAAALQGAHRHQQRLPRTVHIPRHVSFQQTLLSVTFAVTLFSCASRYASSPAAPTTHCYML
jgi:hypothetical protein